MRGFYWQGSPTSGGVGYEEEVGATLKAGQVTHVMVRLPVDNCKCLTSWDCQSKRIFDENGAYPCLQAMSCSGTNNTAVFSKAAHPRNSEEPQVWKKADVAHTLNTFSSNENRCDELVVAPTYCIQGNTIDRSDTAGANGKGVIEGKSYTLNTVDRPAVAYAVGIQPNNSSTAGGLSEIEEKSTTLSVTKLAGVCYARSGFGEFVESKTTGTLRASAAEHGVSSQDVIAEPISFENSSFGGYKQGVGTLKASGGDYGGGSENLICLPCSYNSSGNDIDGAIEASYFKDCGVVSGIEREFDSTPIEIENNFYVWTVRRLTPLECEQLQGFEADWTKYDTKGNKRKDTPRYKACGNSIAIPCAERVFLGIVEAENAS